MNEQDRNHDRRTSLRVAETTAPYGLPIGSLSDWRSWALILGPALLFGLIEAAQLRLGSAVLGRPMPFHLAVLRVVPYWVLLACLLPLAMAAARRFHLSRHVLWPTAPALAASAIAFALLTLAGRLVVGPIGPVFVQWKPSQLFRTYFLLDVLTYSALVGTLYAFYFYRQAAARELAASQLRASLAQARLRVLQAQLEPHFLFNTLNAISMLALEGNHTAVVETIGRLRELLRVSLSHDRPQEVSLARELELVEGYLGIQRVRFADRLSVAYDIAPNTFDAEVPSMILQPLVENAVIHGISADTGACRVTITAARDGASLRLDVRDTGPGFASTSNGRSEGIGLVNTRARLQQLYGSEQRIDCFDAVGGGACVAIWIPFKNASQAALSA
jgi:two-component system LytT family sensor kinase